MTQYGFNQVDVFTTGPFMGNPVAVVHNADDLSTEQMLKIARWQNLSETTFVLKPTHPEADYRVRIFTTGDELPFAGHPTLGTAKAVLSRGLTPKSKDYVVQECEKGLVKVRKDGDNFFFSSPEADLDVYGGDALTKALGAPNFSLTGTIVDVGARFVVVPLDSAEMVRSFEINPAALAQVCQEANVTGLMTYGPNLEKSSEPKYEVRTHFVENGVTIEDPVCGSGNAAVARYLESFGERTDYEARQGTCLGRKGLVLVRYTDSGLWVGGNVTMTTEGSITI